MGRPVIFVLAGVNGAGKSSIGGHLLTQAGASWFNPDTYARALVQEYAYPQQEANSAAWNEGVRRLEAAVSRRKAFAFETTLGGTTITQKLLSATASHDVLVWFCGLRDAEQHIARVRLRVAQGGHDIPEARIRERCRTALINLLALMPHLAELRVYDNSRDVAVGTAIADPKLLLHQAANKLLFPTQLNQARNTPDWAKPLLEAAWVDSA